MVSCPYTPQQNGLAERKHMHVVETAITLMTDANLSSMFWYHAVSHATFLINRMPCRNLQMKSPYQILFGQNPEIHHLRIFGSAVYPLLRPYNENKLQHRSAQCVFLGFVMGYKGVVCYNLSTKKLLLSIHVIHDEEIFPCKNMAVSTTTRQQQSNNVSQAPIVIQLPHSGSAAQNVDLHSSRQLSHEFSRHNDTLSSGNSLNPESTSSTASAQNELVSATSNSMASMHSGPVSLSPHQHHHHHHSDTKVISQSPLFPVHTSSQLEVILPSISSSSQHSLSGNSSDTHNENSVHPMVTRLRSGAIERKHYDGLLATFPELHTLQLSDEDLFHGGYSFISEVTDATEPSCFRKAVSIPQWQCAMQEEYDSLRAQGTCVLVPAPKDRYIVGSKWVYKVKKNPDGSVSRYKARLVA